MNKLVKPIKPRLTLSKAVKEMCYRCGYDPLAEGTNNQQIEWCKDNNCALWDHRPITSKAKGDIKLAKYEAMSDKEKAIHDAKSAIASERFKNMHQNKEL